jgi:hypothetical protein
MPDLIIRMLIPIPTGPGIGAPALTFSQCLPLGEDQGIKVENENLSLRLWFDISSTYWASQPTVEELPRMVNVLAHHINAEITVRDVKNELLAYMQNRDRTRQPTTEELPLQDAYDELAARSLTFTLRTLNRLIGYARSIKGQHWLREFEIGATSAPFLCHEFKATAQSDGKPFPLAPSNKHVIQINLPSKACYITAGEWDDIRAFVRSTNRVPLAPMLLSDAEALAAMGHRRSALVQGVTALEVSVNEFARQPDADRAFGPKFANRLGTPSLSKQVEHMGLSGSVNYLLPLLFSEADLPQAVVEHCRKAVALRNNIVHNGQRDVAEDLLAQSLRAIRSMCEVLERTTIPANDRTPAASEDPE